MQCEAEYGIELTPDMPAWTWATRHAVWLNTRYVVRATGTTAYMEAFGTEYDGEICRWGELVMFQFLAQALSGY